MAFQTKKTVVVPLDISDVINLNHLDVIPSRFQAGLSKSVADNEPLIEPALALSKSPVERNQNPSYTNPSKLQENRRGTERAICRRKSPRTVITKGFDRRGKMSRVIADYTEDSESCECYKQARLLKRYNLLRMRQQVNLAEMFSHSSVGSPESSSSSVMETDNESETLVEQSERVEFENSNEERQFEDVGVGETPSAAMMRLTEALKQLESTCSDASQVHEDYRPPRSILNTLRPSRTNPFIRPSSSSQWRTVMASNSCLGSCLVKDSNLTLRSYVTPSNLKQSQDYLQHSAPSSQYTGYLEITPPTVLSDQKTAAIWDWVSSKYTCENPTALMVPECSKLNTNACNELCASNPRMESPQVNLQRTSLARSFSDAARLTSCRRPLKAFEPIDISHSVPPRTPIIDPPPLFGPRTPPVNTTERYVQLTPPSSSTVWNFSPLYRGSSSVFPVAEKSNCSLTPAVNSLASLNDVRSGDDVATCSTASTVTELDCTSPEIALQNSPKTPSDHYILNLIGQICKPAEEKEKVRDEAEATTVPAQTTIPEPILPKEQVLTRRLSNEEPMVEIAAVKPRRSVSPCSVTASDLHLLKMKVSGQSLFPRTPIINVKLDQALISESRGSIGMTKKQQRRKNKKGKRMGNLERVGVQYCNDDDEKNWKRCVNDRDTQTANEKSIKVRPTESESNRLRKLKNALPRTPGGSYSFRNRIAEAAIAEYVKAELEASLLSPKALERKIQKPRLPSLDSFLKKIMTSSDVKCGCRGRGGPPAPKIRVPQRSTALVKKAPLTAKVKPPFKPTDTSPRWHPIPPSIPKISTRVNFLKYQQQSLAALIGKSRASKQALVPGAVNADSRVPLSYSYLSLYPKDFQHSVSGWNNSYPNFNKLRGNRNNVTVVFGDSQD